MKYESGWRRVDIHLILCTWCDHLFWYYCFNGRSNACLKHVNWHGLNLVFTWLEIATSLIEHHYFYITPIFRVHQLCPTPVPSVIVKSFVLCEEFYFRTIFTSRHILKAASTCFFFLLQYLCDVVLDILRWSEKGRTVR